MTFNAGDRIRNKRPGGSNFGRTGVVVRRDADYDIIYRGGAFVLQYDGIQGTRTVYGDSLGRETPKSTKDDARTLRAKIQKRIDAYKSVENPTTAVKAVIEELEGVLAL